MRYQTTQYYFSERSRPLTYSVMKFYNIFFITIFCLLFAINSFGQTSFKEKSDPEATKILKNLKDIYNKYDAIEIEYSLEIENGEDKEIQQGKILQQGDKYRITNNGNIIINDTKLKPWSLLDRAFMKRYSPV